MDAEYIMFLEDELAEQIEINASFMYDHYE